MKLFVFLGNIGAKYIHTRHNAGFLFADYLRAKWGFAPWQEMSKFFGTLSEGEKNASKIIFLKPATLMNRSGKALLAVKNFYKIPTENILLCYDDKDLEFGTVRFRESGSSAGHNGVKDCLGVLGTEEVQRIKIGVDTPEREKFTDTADFVLSKFSAEELAQLDEIFAKAEEKIPENFF